MRTWLHEASFSDQMPETPNTRANICELSGAERIQVIICLGGCDGTPYGVIPSAVLMDWEEKGKEKGRHSSSSAPGSLLMIYAYSKRCLFVLLFPCQEKLTPLHSSIRGNPIRHYPFPVCALNMHILYSKILSFWHGKLPRIQVLSIMNPDKHLSNTQDQLTITDVFPMSWRNT